MKAKTVHPFPARMAPDLALKVLRGLPTGSLVVDPMCGSGTVVRFAADLGHAAVGADVDPLAVLMSRVWSEPVEPERVRTHAAQAADCASKLTALRVPWIDDDPETRRFVRYWFAEPQQSVLRALALTLRRKRGAVGRALRLALSRTIVTKDKGASLARDVSHSRPHKVCESTDYDVLRGFLDAADRIAKALEATPPTGSSRVHLQDGRTMGAVATGSADCVITSPPYLNAIDYLRGHRLALVWLGRSVEEIRDIRADSVGAERRSLLAEGDEDVRAIRSKCSWIESLPTREKGMIGRYTLDMLSVARMTDRVLKPDGSAVFVVGDSTLRGTYVQNSLLLKLAMNRTGFRLVSRAEREIPPSSRYLPPPGGADSSLDKRMRTEVVMKFRRSAKRSS